MMNCVSSVKGPVCLGPSINERRSQALRHEAELQVAFAGVCRYFHRFSKKLAIGTCFSISMGTHPSLFGLLNKPSVAVLDIF